MYSGDVPGNYKRLTVGWRAGNQSIKERQWYAALADVVGHTKAPEYADEIINWKLGRPPESVLGDWLHQYDDEEWTVDDRIRVRVENKVARFHKQEHITFLRRVGQFGITILDKATQQGAMPDPVQLKYAGDAYNQGMMLHSARSQPTESLSLGGLTINVGNRPTPRKLKPKQVEQVIEGTFTEVPAQLGSPRD